MGSDMCIRDRDKGIVSTTEHEASSAAIEVLNKGGNAIDAPLAASGTAAYPYLTRPTNYSV